MAMVDHQEFEKYMDVGNNAAWDHDWSAAIEAYSQAVQVRPENPDAHINLGLALLNNGQLDRALKVYKRAHQLSPDDPIPLERSADVLERMGQLKEAAQQYVKVSDVYLAMRDLDKAIGNWERATQLTPGLVSVHARLAQAYERVGDKQKAIREYLTLAFNFRRVDDLSKAIRAVERALRLDKNNPQALNTLRALKSGGEVILPDDITSRSKPEAKPEADPFGMPLENATPDVGEAHPLGPIGEAMDEGLGLLAAHVVESGLNEYVMHAMQGMENQRQDDVEQAIAAYNKAYRGGLQHPALRMNLGGLLLRSGKAQEALPHFEEAAKDRLMMAGALHGAGKAYYQLKKHKEASNYLIRSLRAVDTALAMDDNEISELSQVYDNLIVALDGRTNETLQAVNERFVDLLSGKDWKQRIADTRRHIDEALSDASQDVVGMLSASGGDDLPDIVASIDRYIRAGLFTLAMDEAHRAVEHSPYYLPVHVRMAEVMMKEGRIRQAINKYNSVARSYMVREENDRAASILREVLEMAPLDIEVRVNLIELLEQEDRWAEALDQYIDLAETYQQLGDFEQANQIFTAAEGLARRIKAPTSKIVDIKHNIADINQMRLNTRQALKIYEEILEIASNDEKALRSLVDIYYTQGNSVEAVKRLDKLLGVYAKAGAVQRITQLLEELVSTHQNDMALRQRLASMYRRSKQTREAIEQLDALGELQLDAGLHKEAAQTIKQIIAMKPDRVDDYKRLLAQLNA